MALFFFDSVNILVKSDHGDPGPNHSLLSPETSLHPIFHIQIDDVSPVLDMSQNTHF